MDLSYAVKEEKKEKKNNLLELRWKSRLAEETALRFLCQCHVLHFILHCFRDETAEPATHELWGYNGMPV